MAIALLLPFPASAQELVSDLGLTVSGIPERAVPGTTIDWSVTFTNRGPDALPTVHLRAYIGEEMCIDTDLPFEAGQSRVVQCRITLPQAPPYTVIAGANIWAPDRFDRDYQDNNYYQGIAFVTRPDLSTYFGTNEIAVPGLALTVPVHYDNLAFSGAEDVRLTIDLPAAISVSTATPGCTVSGTRVVCELGDIASTDWGGTRPGGVVTLEVVAPEGSDVRWEGTAEITSPSGDEVPANNRRTFTFRNYRTFYVTNTNDEGSGSLREAIHSANASCAGQNPCLIAFRIPDVGDVASIRPRTPLPLVTAEYIFIDGQTQHRYFGRGDIRHPLIELRGSELREGDGLVLTSPCRLHVRGLAINGFPGHGLHTSITTPCPTTSFSNQRLIEQNFLGTDVTGNVAIPNLRGVYMDGNVNPMLRRNVISGNRRAGVFVARGYNSHISQNVIGLNASGTVPLGNGASGIYIAAEGDGTDAYDNHIAFNADAGVSIDREATYVNIYRNAIHGNRQMAIDFGLDGPTSSEPRPAPVVLSAQYDAATGATTIVVALAPGAVNYGYLHVYANDAPEPDGYAEAQYYLGEAKWNDFRQRYELVHTATDLRGKWINAQTIEQIITTFSTEPRPEGWGPYANTTSSEMGRAIQVQ